MGWGFRRGKFNAQPTEVDGVRFASKKEAGRYQHLRLLEKVGEIRGLQLQPKFRITIDGKLVCTYVADFAYLTGRGKHTRRVVEDAKGVRTPIYRLKKKLVKICCGIEIVEV